MPSIFQVHERGRRERNEALRLRVRDDLRRALRKFAPGEEVYVFGSLPKPGQYTEWSDVDVAFVEEPKKTDHLRLIGELTDALGRRVDVVILSKTRLREEILREGERWTDWH